MKPRLCLSSLLNIMAIFKTKIRAFQAPFPQMKAMKTSETYVAHTPPMGEDINEQKLFMECVHIFALS